MREKKSYKRRAQVMHQTPSKSPLDKERKQENKTKRKPTNMNFFLSSIIKTLLFNSSSFKSKRKI